MMIIKTTPIPNTSRSRVEYEDGSTLDRGMVYLETHQWDNLKRLATLQGTSGSKVLGRLIDLATKFKTR